MLIGQYQRKAKNKDLLLQRAVVKVGLKKRHVMPNGGCKSRGANGMRAVAEQEPKRANRAKIASDRR
jgi:hypothetical protein